MFLVDIGRGHIRTLIVLDRTDVTQRLIDLVGWRARQRSCSFALLVPALVSEELFGDKEVERTLRRAIPPLEEAARGPVTPMKGHADALLAIERVLVGGHFDGVLISTLPDRVARWLGRDLGAKVERLGLPVAVIRTKAARRPLHPPMQIGGA